MDKQRSKSDVAFACGQQDSADGVARDANPYTRPGDIRAAWWGEGWCAARAVREELEEENYASCHFAD